MLPVCRNCGFTDFYPMTFSAERKIKMQCLSCGEYTHLELPSDLASSDAKAKGKA